MQQPQPTSRETVRVLAALSDENRFRIVELLAESGEELTCGAIAKALGISPSLLSHHLSILSEAGIVGRRKNGLWTMNFLERTVITRQVEALKRLAGANGNGSAPAAGEGEPDDPSLAVTPEDCDPAADQDESSSRVAAGS